MQKSIENYKKYDFSRDKNWSSYLDNLYPTPSIDKTESFKRKYYKRIDPDFDVNFKEEE
jgi:hypothetical protein